jgi:hypothetical protein
MYCTPARFPSGTLGAGFARFIPFHASAAGPAAKCRIAPRLYHPLLRVSVFTRKSTGDAKSFNLQRRSGRLQFYRLSGLAVGSEIALPGMIAAPPEHFPQVTIRRGEVPANLPGAAASGPTWQIAGREFLLRVPDIARFLLRDGNEIVVAPEAPAREADLPIFILGTAFGILMHQRERIVLHASAVRVGGRAVLFCGPSGTGIGIMK